MGESRIGTAEVSIMESKYMFDFDLDSEIEGLFGYGPNIEKQIDYLHGKIEISVRESYTRSPKWGVTYDVEIKPIDYESKYWFTQEFYTTEDHGIDIPDCYKIIASEIKEIFNVLYGLPSNSKYATEIKDCLEVATPEFLENRRKERHAEYNICCKCTRHTRKDLPSIVNDIYPFFCLHCSNPSEAMRRSLLGTFRGICMPGLASLLGNQDNIYPEQWT